MTSGTLSLAEWTVLAVLDEGPTHGFAVATLTAPEGGLGRVWQVPRPVVYRALARLESLGLATPLGEEEGHGPPRQVLTASAVGRARVHDWLLTPVEHVREVRSALLMKLALLDRRGADPGPLLTAQRDLLAPIVAGLARADRGGFDAVLAAWRRTNAEATLAFVTELLGERRGAP
jgi:DNA-binding PadR family transcriptional regulator